jgi:hypothetical protein
LLYFNLPFEDIIKNCEKPDLLFSIILQNDKNNHLAEICNKFKEKRNDINRLANIFLFEIHENQAEDSNQSAKDTKIIIGGYASDGWFQNEHGNNTSFLFNLTADLRFNAIPDRQIFKSID